MNVYLRVGAITVEDGLSWGVSDELAAKAQML